MTAIAINGDARKLLLPDESVHCVVTSPPYNVSVMYHDYKDSVSWVDYCQLAYDVARELNRVLVNGGRVWVNAPAAVPYSRDAAMPQERTNVQAIWYDALWQEGFTYRDTIVWRQDSHDGACAWGSWKKPSAPNLRGCWEAVLCFYKGEWKREGPADYEDDSDIGGPWTDLVRNVWDITPARSDKYAPAPFPIELPARCIRLSTWPGEVVLDPFGGSGTTAKAADLLGRVGISVDISRKQTDLAGEQLFNLFS